MKIEWVNHAGFVAEHGDVRLISDAWLEGTAFDDGWKLLSQTAFGYERFAGITHLWLSHEHPDHFSPLSLRKIPAEDRARITFLFQKTADRKVVRFCEDLGFGKIVELERRRWYQLGDDFRVLNEPFPYGDSGLLIEAGGKRVANVNDCTVETARHAHELRDLFSVPSVDLLLTQFSYANWVGNPDDPDTRRQGAEEKLTTLRNHVRWLQPTFTIPFASFVWFCHAENYYMNDLVNKIDDVAGLLARETPSTPVVLYPGETWEVGAAHDNGPSIERYLADYRTVDSEPELITAPAVPEADLRASAEAFVHQIVGGSGARATFHRLGPSPIWVTDYDRALELSVERGLVPVEVPRERCDVTASSEALANAFRNLWGGDTLQINGRFTVPSGGDYMRFRRYMILSSKLNVHGSYSNYVRWRLVDVARHPAHTANRVRERLTKRGRPAGGLTVAPGGSR
jgi:UDP-MurNAc hydroxylase